MCNTNKDVGVNYNYEPYLVSETFQQICRFLPLNGSLNLKVDNLYGENLKFKKNYKDKVVEEEKKIIKDENLKKDMIKKEDNKIDGEKIEEKDQTVKIEKTSKQESFEKMEKKYKLGKLNLNNDTPSIPFLSSLTHLKLDRRISKSKDQKDRKMEFKKKRSESFVLFSQNSWLNNNDLGEEIILKADEKNYLRVIFKFRPEYVKVGQKIVIYDQKIKATGVVTEIL